MRYPKIDKNDILIFKEHHGSRYFIIHDEEDFKKAIVNVFNSRKEDSYFYETIEQLEELVQKYTNEVKDLEDGLAALQALPDTMVALKRSIAGTERDIKNYKSSLAQYIESRNFYAAALKGDVKDIYIWMQYRSRNEYEGYEIEPSEDY